ncbi:MAG: ribosome-associated translation inhibitor RaiA [Oscillospiraceae bacterium]|nr:ribosome-associated translation inhibitor RaiA [Oscillospiraceae bacterium]
MKCTIVGKNMSVSSILKERAIKKINKLDKFFSSETEANATMSILKNWHIFELTIKHKGIVFRAEERSDDMYASIDRAVDIVERQIRKNKTRLSRKIHEAAFKITDVMDETIYVEEEYEFKVVRSKKFSLKPMTAEEAILQMNLLSHEFFVFVNSDTRQVNVVYKRDSGDYGLIEPGE